MSVFPCIFKEVEKGPVGILGCGISGQSVFRYLSEAYPAMTFVLRDQNPNAFSFASFNEKAVVSRKSGDAWLEDIKEKILFRSPGVRHDLPALERAKENGTIVTSETALFCDLCPASIFAVTGSDGKTTTVSMTAAILRTAAKGQRNVYLGGNIGESLLSALNGMTALDEAVLELSSFQLADLTPRVYSAALLNVTENHLNWHTSMQEYASAKSHLLAGAEARVLFADDATVSSMAREGDCLFSSKQSLHALLKAFGERPYVYLQNGKVWLYVKGESQILFDASVLRQSGEPFLLDAMAAAALARSRASREDMEAALASFSGVLHRMTYLGKKNEISIYDSGADTTPSRTAATLSAIGECDTVLCGGSGKGLSYIPLAKAIANKGAFAVLYGQTAASIAEALGKEGVTFVQAQTLADAVEYAMAHTKKGGTLLFSPACASFDAFSDYKARSRAFYDMIFKER